MLHRDNTIHRVSLKPSNTARKIQQHGTDCLKKRDRLVLNKGIKHADILCF